MKKQIIVHDTYEDEEILACGYVRTSDDDDEAVESYHAQIDHWETEIPQMPRHKLVGVFGDEGISGQKQKHRHDFNEMIKLCKLGRIKRIYTKSLARFGRNMIETVETIKELREIGVSVHFEIDRLNTAKLSDEMMVRIRAVTAEHEAKTMGDNVRWSVRHRLAEGIVEQGFIYGYDIIREKDKPIRFVINEAEAEIVRLIFDLYAHGVGKPMIVKYLNNKGVKGKLGGNWSTATLADMLENEKYIGDALLQKWIQENKVARRNKNEIPQTYVENNHEPIISAELFEKVKALRSEKRAGMTIPYTRKKTEFSSLVQCAYCGKKYGRTTNSKIKNFSNIIWMCQNKNSYGLKKCLSNNITEELLQEMMLDAYNEYLATAKENDTTAEIQTARKELVGQEHRVRELYQSGQVSYATFIDVQNKIKADFKALDERMTNEQGFELYRKQGKPASEYAADIVTAHIEGIVVEGYKLTFTFNNKQKVEKEFKYEHRTYRKAY